jgi:hypothetical protein
MAQREAGTASISTGCFAVFGIIGNLCLVIPGEVGQ